MELEVNSYASEVFAFYINTMPLHKNFPAVKELFETFSENYVTVE